MLGDTLRDSRVSGEEIEVLLNGAGRYGPEQPFLRLCEVPLYHEPEHPFETGDGRQQLLLGFRRKNEHFAVFERFDINVTWSLVMKAGNITYPPVFHRELQRHLCPRAIDKIGADTAFENIGFKLTNLPLL